MGDQRETDLERRVASLQFAERRSLNTIFQSCGVTSSPQHGTVGFPFRLLLLPMTHFDSRRSYDP